MSDTHDETIGGIHAHVMPVPVLLGVWAALMVLTVFTVAMSDFDLGFVDLWIAMGVATVKASLVGLFFMHLRYDKPFNAMVFLSSVAFVGLFIIASMTDTAQYQNLIHLNLLKK
jgi:cytochrome c oxidase subunit 4